MSHQALTSKGYVSDRTRAIRRVLWAILFLNLGVAAAKYIYGTISGSAAMQADGIHSVFDSAGNVVGLVGLSIAARPADDNHPYGHAKFETYASMVIGVLLLVAAFGVGSSAVENLMADNHEVDVTPISFAVMIITLAINLGVTWYERRRGKELRSEILAADASHTLSDALVSIGVIIGLILVLAGFPIADSIVALVVMLVILYTAFDVFKQAFATLSDRARIPEKDIFDIVTKVKGVKDAHHIRTRGPQGEVNADLHVLVDPAMPVSDAHELSETVERVLIDAHPQIVEVLVHIEPNDGHVD